MIVFFFFACVCGCGCGCGCWFVLVAEVDVLILLEVCNVSSLFIFAAFSSFYVFLFFLLLTRVPISFITYYYSPFSFPLSSLLSGTHISIAFSSFPVLLFFCLFTFLLHFSLSCGLFPDISYTSCYYFQFPHSSFILLIHILIYLSYSCSSSYVPFFSSIFISGTSSSSSSYCCHFPSANRSLPIKLPFLLQFLAR